MIFAFRKKARRHKVGRFSAIARSVMIFAPAKSDEEQAPESFSAIARSVMIFASVGPMKIRCANASFSAIARSVMIFAPLTYAVIYKVFVAICRVPIFENTLIDKKTL